MSLILPRRKALLTGAAGLITCAMGPTQRRAVVGNANGNLLRGLVGYWKFDEGSGTTTRDSSPEGVSPASFAAGSPTWAAGKFGNALSFDGSSNLTIANTAVNIQAPLSIFCWVKFSSGAGSTATQGIIGGNQVSNYGFLCGTSGFQFVSQYTTQILGYASASFGIGNWYHFGITYSSSGLCVGYVNGTQIASSNILVTFAGYGSYLISASYGSSGITGSIDELRVYNRSFSGSEVAQLYRFHPDEGQ